MKLKQINEVKHVGQPDMFYGTATMDDDQINVTAPFSTEKEAKKYIEWEMKEFDLEEEHRARVILIEPPSW